MALPKRQFENQVMVFLKWRFEGKIREGGLSERTEREEAGSNLLGLYSLIWPISGYSAGQGIFFYLSVLNRVYNFA